MSQDSLCGCAHTGGKLECQTSDAALQLNAVSALARLVSDHNCNQLEEVTKQIEHWNQGMLSDSKLFSRKCVRLPCSFSILKYSHRFGKISTDSSIAGLKLNEHFRRFGFKSLSGPKQPPRQIGAQVTIHNLEVSEMNGAFGVVHEAPDAGQRLLVKILGPVVHGINVVPFPAPIVTSECLLHANLFEDATVYAALKRSFGRCTQISDACWSRISRRHLIRIFTRAARCCPTQVLKKTKPFDMNAKPSRSGSRQAANSPARARRYSTIYSNPGVGIPRRSHKP